MRKDGVFLPHPPEFPYLLRGMIDILAFWVYDRNISIKILKRFWLPFH